MENPDIIFTHLGIQINKLNEVAFSIFGVEIYWYALFICSGLLGGLAMATYLAKKTKQDTDIYSEFLVWAMISSIIGARLYYVAFSWSDYKDNLSEIFNLREGGLAVYGGVLMACVALAIFTKVKKLNFWILADTASVGIFVGQILGRLGNFFNKEAFGGYTDGPFAMAIKRSEIKYVPQVLKDKIQLINGVEYLQVHPMFLYEIVWNIVMMSLVLVYFKKRRFNGEIFALYFVCYGLGRAWMETMRTDQLLIGSSNIPVSVVVSILLVIVAGAFIFVNRKRANRLGLPYPQDVIEAMVDEKPTDNATETSDKTESLEEAVDEVDEVDEVDVQSEVSTDDIDDKENGN